jgi:ADP-ribosylglycohydrolase
MSSIPYLAGWAPAEELVRAEARQLIEEGRDPKWIEALLATARDPDSLADFWDQLHAAPPRPDFAFREPSALEEIRRERNPGLRSRPLGYGDETLKQRLLGAWLGRCCGCALGKPVEMFMGAANGLSSRERIKVYLEAIAPGEYPLRDYFPLHSPAEARTGSLLYPASTRENIAFMESDDDINYTVIGQRVLITHGLEFITLDVMKTWVELLRYSSICTAETQAYRNYLLRYNVRWGREAEVDWTWVATHQNPYREWIGAQIRADSWGYAAPGNPELAAELAWRDARLSHVKNGIYGEMFAAAMIAAAFALNDPQEVVATGLAEIPTSSRLHLAIRQTVEICRRHDFQHARFEEVLGEIYQLFGHYDPVHTINNAALVVAALLLGGGDFEQAITIAVMGGWDTDCNGATVGSIFGAMHGAERIPARWKDRLNDTLYAEIAGYQPIAISECARRSFEIVRNPAKAESRSALLK